jgi:NAD(P)-dependent dehydrogenase (short-subunit alcohol dehydrogenase family)
MTKHEDLNGKVAIVTGANGGMGAAISMALAQAGALVVASDIAAEPGALLHDAPHNLTYLQADVSDANSVAALVQHAVSTKGPLHCAVNAAGIEFEMVPLAECADDDFDRIISVNLRGTFLSMKHEIQAMLVTGGGSIVNLASTTSFRPGRSQAAYTASKHGVVGLTRAGALDYSRHGIRINAIAPGNIDTPMLRSAIERRGRTMSEIEGRMPLGRFGTSDEIASAALFLCSAASSFTTGHVLAVEGGMLVN